VRYLGVEAMTGGIYGRLELLKVEGNKVFGIGIARYNLLFRVDDGKRAARILGKQSEENAETAVAEEASRERGEYMRLTLSEK
jgi:hypothetical protein